MPNAFLERLTQLVREPAGAETSAALDALLAVSEKLGGAPASLVGWLSEHGEAPTTALLGVADALFKAQSFKLAYDTYEFVSLRPLSNDQALHAKLKLGQIAKRRGDTPAALTFLQSARAIQPSHPMLALELATLHVESGAPDAAEAVLSGTPMPDHLKVTWHRLKGTTARLRHDFAVAADHYERAVELNPADSQSALDLVSVLIAAGKSVKARACAQRAVEEAPQSEPAWRLLGKACVALGDHAAAREAFAAASACDPTKWEPLAEAGMLALRVNDLERALEFGRAASALAPKAEMPLRLMAEALRISGDVVAYEKVLSRIVDLLPDALVSKIDLLLLRLSKGELQPAGQSLRGDARAIAANQPALLRLATTALQAGCAKAAGVLVESASACASLSPAGVALLAQTKFQSGDFLAAHEVLDRELDRQANSPEIVFKSIELHLKQGDWMQALRRLTEAQLPESHRVALLRGEIFLSGGAIEAAARAVADIVPTTSDEGIRHAMLVSRLYEAMGRDDEAAEELARVVDLVARHPAAMTERLRLAIKTGNFENARRLLQALEAGDGAKQRLSSGRPWDMLKEIFNEWRLDPDAVLDLERVLERPVGERQRGLIELARNWPENTVIAGQLLRQMRPVGPSDVSPGYVSAIPRTIFQYWHESELPIDLASYTATIRAANADHEIVVLNPKSALGLLRGFGDRDAEVAFVRAKEIAQQVDLLRLALLYYRGGWYADIDTRGLSSLTLLDRPDARLILYRDQLSALGNDLIGAAAGHPAIGRALRAAADAIIRGDQDSVWLSTGPGLLTRSVAQYLAEAAKTVDPNLSQSPHRDIVVHEIGVIRAVIASHCAASYKLTNAHWSRMHARNLGPTRLERWWDEAAHLIRGQQGT